MATKEKDTAVTKAPAKKRTRKPVSLKIDSKRKKAQTARAAEKSKKKKVKLTIKNTDMKRVVRKSQLVIRRSLKAALKGVDVVNIPNRVYKKIDSSIAKNPAFMSAVEASVIAIVNTLTSGKTAKNSTRKPRVKKENTVKDAAAKDTATVTDQKKKPRAKKKTDAPAESVTA